jgi:hypothetical protein
MNCPQCQVKYNNSNNLPRILYNCGHTFCEECLNILHKQQSCKNISCPLCQTENLVEDVNTLTKNLVLVENTLQISSSNVSFIEKEKEIIPNKKSQKLICPSHSKDLEAFCETDKMMLCVSCILESDHKNHDLSSIDKAAQKERAFIQSGYDKVLELESQLSDSLQKIEDMKKIVITSTESRIEDNEIFFEEMILIIKERQYFLEQNIKKNSEEEVVNLEKKTQNVYSKINKVKDFKEFKNNLDNLSEFEILSKSRENLKILMDVGRSISIDVSNLKEKESEFLRKIDINKEEEITLIKKSLGKILKPVNVSLKDSRDTKENNINENFKTNQANQDILNVQLQIANVQAKLEKMQNIKQKENITKNNTDNLVNVFESRNFEDSRKNSIPVNKSPERNEKHEECDKKIINTNLNENKKSTQSEKNLTTIYQDKTTIEKNVTHSEKKLNFSGKVSPPLIEKIPISGQNFNTVQSESVISSKSTNKLVKTQKKVKSIASSARSSKNFPSNNSSSIKDVTSVTIELNNSSAVNDSKFQSAQDSSRKLSDKSSILDKETFQNQSSSNLNSTSSKCSKRLALFPALKMKTSNEKFKNLNGIEIKEAKDAKLARESREVQEREKFEDNFSKENIEINSNPTQGNFEELPNSNFNNYMNFVKCESEKFISHSSASGELVNHNSQAEENPKESSNPEQIILKDYSSDEDIKKLDTKQESCKTTPTQTKNNEKKDILNIFLGEDENNQLQISDIGEPNLGSPNHIDIPIDINLENVNIRNSLLHNSNTSRLFNNDLDSLYLSVSCYILLLGGKSETPSKKYCIESDTWNNYELSVDRSDFVAVNYKDKKILILGGRVTGNSGGEVITDSIDLLNTKDKTIKRLEIKMKFPRINFGVVYVNNKLYVAGGSNGKDVLNNFEYFEKRSRIWCDLPKMQNKRREFGMIIGPDNCIYVIGGSDEKE